MQTVCCYITLMVMVCERYIWIKITSTMIINGNGGWPFRKNPQQQQEEAVFALNLNPNQVIFQCYEHLLRKNFNLLSCGINHGFTDSATSENAIFRPIKYQKRVVVPTETIFSLLITYFYTSGNSRPCSLAHDVHGWPPDDGSAG